MSNSEFLEEVIETTGSCGIYQVFLTLIFHYGKAIVIWNYHFMTFNEQVPQIFCKQSRNTSVKHKKEDLCEGNSTKCNTFSFDENMTTIVSEWNLVCGRQWVPTFIFTLLLIGAVIGSVLSGTIADKIGRKPVMYGSILCLVILNCVSALSFSWQMYAALQFLIGLAIEGYTSSGTILMAEYAPQQWRARVVTVPSRAIGASLFALIAWRLHDWQQLHFLCAVVAVLFLLTWCFVQESFRWMTATGRNEAAEKAICRIAKMNRADTPDLSKFLSALNDTSESKLCDLFTNIYLLKITVVLWIVWISSFFTFFGITFGVNNISGDLYMNMFLLNIVDVPVSIISPWIINRCGRKWILSLSSLFSGIIATAIGVLKYHESHINENIVRVASFVAQAFAVLCYQILPVYTLELYPTTVRSTALGSHYAASDIAVAVTPLVISMEQDVPGLLYYISGVLMAICAVLIILFLHETKGLVLQDTIDTAYTESKQLKKAKKDGNSYRSLE